MSTVVAAGTCALTASASSQAVEQSWERPSVLPIFEPLLLRVSSPPLVSHPTALLTQSPRVAAPQEDEAESATPAEVSELIGARASSTHRGRVRGLS